MAKVTQKKLNKIYKEIKRYLNDDDDQIYWPHGVMYAESKVAYKIVNENPLKYKKCKRRSFASVVRATINKIKETPFDYISKFKCDIYDNINEFDLDVVDIQKVDELFQKECDKSWIVD